MGCCGNRSAATEWQVTFRDGSKKTVKTVAEARILRAQDTSVDPNGRRKAAAITPIRKL